MLELLQTSTKFFESAESTDDAIRAEREKEAGKGLRAVLERIESDVASKSNFKHDINLCLFVG